MLNSTPSSSLGSAPLRKNKSQEARNQHSLVLPEAVWRIQLLGVLGKQVFQYFHT
jgi:hypothetical protein